jgi:glutathione synthase/RimK-type ligase-like ATP-grasp enzyme
MSISLIPVTLVSRKSPNNSDCTLEVSNNLCQQLELNSGQDLSILLGKKMIKMKIQIIEKPINEITFPENIFHEFYLPIQTYKFQAYYNPEIHTLQLGPILGLLTDFEVKEGAEPHFRSIHLFCEELHRAIEEIGGFFYIFSYSHFSKEGYYYQNGKWIPSMLPLPNVIYNRIHSRRLEYVKEFKKFRKSLEQLNIPLFNERFLSKWEVYNQLSEEQHLQAFLPETKLFTFENLMELAKKYETVFIKPVHGSQGRNILKISKQDENSYSYQTSFQLTIDAKKYLLDDIYQQIKPLLGNRIYIIQQGIPLLTHVGSIMDFRVLCHKNCHHLWEVTSMVARISAEQEMVSNLAKGGKVMKPFEALGSCMNNRKAFEILQLIKELAIETAATISKNSQGITGELGIDIGVDKDGRLWLIEVNSKPSKNFEDGQGKIRPSAKAIVQLCTLLTFETSRDLEET